jgi:CheY-like chemotaxis protein
MNGIDATARIKTDNPDTIIIGLSVNASTENQETMTRAGATRLIPKEKAADLLYDMMHETIKSR